MKVNPADLSLISLITACFFSLIYPFISFMSLGYNKTITIIIFTLTSFAFVSLFYFHITDNFLISNVYYNSHTTKPLLYKIFGTWGNHEGSIILWIWILSLYSLLLELFIQKEYKIITMSIQHLIGFGFLLFSISTSNPFIQIIPFEKDGLGFNPMLQDIGLTIHPPILYLGYVGFSTVFSISLASLIIKKNGIEWAKIVKPWVLISWSFLTLGIGLGSWWAYRELGWGGFWFWDPVENSSLMPWLLGTALLHVISLVKRFNMFYNFAILLSIFSFILSIVGTFLVRSGILTSIHSFANDPERGFYILILLGTIISAGLVIFICFSHRQQKNSYLPPYSKSTMILVNNLLLITAFFIVFIGTIYPIILEFLTKETISVGSPYYNSIFSILTVILLLFMITATDLHWKKNSKIFIRYKFSFILSLIAFPLVASQNFIIIGMVLLSIMLFSSTIESFLQKIKLFSVSFSHSLKHAKSLPRSYYSMTISHIGVAILVLGIIYSNIWSDTKELYMRENSIINIKKFKITLSEISYIKQQNYNAIRGKFLIQNNSRLIGNIFPESRFYKVERAINTESDIYHHFLSDIYIIIGDIDKQKGIAVRIHYKPYISLIWIGFFVIALGGLISILPKQKLPYRKKQ